MLLFIFGNPSDFTIKKRILNTIFEQLFFFFLVKFVWRIIFLKGNLCIKHCKHTIVLNAVSWQTNEGKEKSFWNPMFAWPHSDSRDGNQSYYTLSLLIHLCSDMVCLLLMEKGEIIKWIRLKKPYTFITIKHIHTHIYNIVWPFCDIAKIPRLFV